MIHHTRKGLPPIQDRITKAKRGYWLRNPKEVVQIAKREKENHSKLHNVSQRWN